MFPLHFRATCCIAVLIVFTSRAQTIQYRSPEFTDSNRRQKVEAVLSEVDQVFRESAKVDHLPGVVYGVVLDGELVHSGTIGLANLQRQFPATIDTGFRIASMSKSFVTLAVMKLRDAGKLRLDDPVAKYLPEFRQVKPPTSDSPAVTIRNLMTMTPGLPEDNPWGDRQMAISREALRKFVSGGLSFSNPPGQTYEYSNLGFVLLGEIVSKASGTPFQRYIERNIFKPLKMENTRWEYSEVPAETFALGYRWEHEKWSPEPILHDGHGAACGGIITTLNDFSKYVRFHLNAWPARDEAEHGPVQRATVREMHKPAILSSFAAKATLLDNHTLNPAVSFYGYGLGWSVDSRQIVSLAHSGGLPGYGSNYRFLPDYNLAIIAFANRTYAPMSRVCGRAINVILEKSDLKPRTILASPILEQRKEEVARLVRRWDDKLADEIVAENFFLDRSRDDWVDLFRTTLEKAGSIEAVGPITPSNQLRGTFPVMAEKGKVNVHFTLTPEAVPKVQELGLVFIPAK